MESIRINELARQLEVKSKAILDYLLEIGVTDKKSHSSALDDQTAEKVRAHFQGFSQPEEVQEAPAVKVAPKATLASPTAEAKPATEPRSEFQPIRRSIAEIKAEVRKAASPPAPRSVPVAEKEKSAERRFDLHASSPATGAVAAPKAPPLGTHATRSGVTAKLAEAPPA